MDVRVWAPKNWCFWTVVLEKTLEGPLDCMEIKPVNPKGKQPWNSLEGLMLKLKLQYFGHLMRRTDSLERPWCWERLKAGGEGDDRGWGGWMASPTRRTRVGASSGSWWSTGNPGVLQSIGSQRVEHDWAIELTEFKVRKKPPGSNINLWNEGWICGCVFWEIPWHILGIYVNGT